MRQRAILWTKSRSAFTSPTRRACGNKLRNPLAAGADFSPSRRWKPGAQPHLSTGSFLLVNNNLVNNNLVNNNLVNNNYAVFFTGVAGNSITLPRSEAGTHLTFF